MKKTTFYLVVFITSIINTLAQSTYNYNVDLVNIKKDKAYVTLLCSNIKSETINFNFPKTVPGTYATQDYGKYISALSAISRTGKKLKVKHTSINTCQISEANNLAEINYWVSDSWDSKTKKNKIFEPAGTNIEAGKNYVLNNAGFFGFFDGGELLPVTLKIKAPSNLIGISSLDGNKSGDQITYQAKSYHELVDCPILVCMPDTAQFKIGNTLVTVGVVTEDGTQGAQKILSEAKESLLAAEKFLGKLPVSNYNFLVYVKNFTEYNDAINGKTSLLKKLKAFKVLRKQAFGALEHQTSSLYFMPDFGNKEYIEQMKDVCIHEFMHIVTPLNLHSEHIGNFNYTNPKMSKHLWLYEGITEYFACLIQLRGEFQTPEKYFKKMLSYIKQGERFSKTMSFTEMSENVLTEPYKAQYGHVYDRGAVLGMLLDIQITKLTNNQKNLRDVIMTLGKKYGPNKSFSEQTFIDEFIAEVHPDLKSFFNNYISGKVNPLPYKETLDYIGVNYLENETIKSPLTFINDSNYVYTNNKKKNMYTIKDVKPNALLPLKKGDKVYEFYLNKITEKEVKENDEVELRVLRNGKFELIKFKAKLGNIVVKQLIKVNATKTPEQQIAFDKYCKN